MASLAPVRWQVPEIRQAIAAGAALFVAVLDAVFDAQVMGLHGSVAGAFAPGQLERRPVCPKPGRWRGVGAIGSVSIRYRRGLPA